ncbi:hypothetical protein ACLKA6_015655 [Drosophila palustris]
MLTRDACNVNFQSKSELEMETEKETEKETETETETQSDSLVIVHKAAVSIVGIYCLAGCDCRDTLTTIWYANVPFLPQLLAPMPNPQTAINQTSATIISFNLCVKLFDITTRAQPQQHPRPISSSSNTRCAPDGGSGNIVWDCPNPWLATTNLPPLERQAVGERGTRHWLQLIKMPPQL